jgi:hypothetical protein
MDFRAAARHLALTIDDDMDPQATMDVDDRPHAWDSYQGPSTDNMDPASPGGPAPYNGADPFGKPVTSNPEWLDPSAEADVRGMPVPFKRGPDVNVTTLHNARRNLYAAKETRTR